MRWEEIRAHYPGQWLLVEAVKAHSKSSKRILDKLAVINVLLTPNKPCRAMKNFIIKIQDVSIMSSTPIAKNLTSPNENG